MVSAIGAAGMQSPGDRPETAAPHIEARGSMIRLSHRSSSRAPYVPTDATLGALLTRQAEAVGDRPYVHLLEDHGGTTTLTFGDVCAAARSTAAWLQSQGIGPQGRIVLVLPTGLPFLSAFFGSLLAGCAVVPCYPPARRKGLEDYQERLARQLKIAAPALIVAPKELRMVVEAAAYLAEVPCRVVEPEAMAAAPESFTPLEPDAEALAIVQFSSGSTGDPRGVMLRHRQVLANVAAIVGTLGVTEEDVNCSWLPLYHDMGLVGGLLCPLYTGRPVALLSPQAFLLDPKRWLWAIHQHRATISTAPNFAYHLVAARVSDAELTGLDLSSWRLALCGAEPVVPSTLASFAERMTRYGLRSTALRPVYGLAELVLGAVFSLDAAGMRVDVVASGPLSDAGRALTGGDCRDVTGFPCLGEPLPGYEVRVMGADGEVLPERTVGEIQLSGPSVMAGYLADAEATARALSDGWLRTGDLGYMADGQLYVVGRSKDLIMRGGRNYAPQDLEQAAARVDGVRQGCVAAFGVPDPTSGTEAVVVVAETRRPLEQHLGMMAAIAESILAATGLRPNHVVLVPPGAVPKTSSGKLQRGKARERWLTGGLQAPVEPGMGAMARVVGRALVQRMVRAGLARRSTPAGEGSS